MEEWGVVSFVVLQSRASRVSVILHVYCCDCHSFGGQSLEDIVLESWFECFVYCDVLGVGVLAKRIPRRISLWIQVDIAVSGMSVNRDSNYYSCALGMVELYMSGRTAAKHDTTRPRIVTSSQSYVIVRVVLALCSRK